MPQIPSEGPCHQATPLPHPRWRVPGGLLTAPSEPDILHAYGCQRVDAGNNHLVNKGIITNTEMNCDLLHHLPQFRTQIAGILPLST